MSISKILLLLISMSYYVSENCTRKITIQLENVICGHIKGDVHRVFYSYPQNLSSNIDAFEKELAIMQITLPNPDNLQVLTTELEDPLKNSLLNMATCIQSLPNSGDIFAELLSRADNLHNVAKNFLLAALSNPLSYNHLEANFNQEITDFKSDWPSNEKIAELQTSNDQYHKLFNEFDELYNKFITQYETYIGNSNPEIEWLENFKSTCEKFKGLTDSYFYKRGKFLNFMSNLNDYLIPLPNDETTNPVVVINLEEDIIDNTTGKINHFISFNGQFSEIFTSNKPKCFESIADGYTAQLIPKQQILMKIYLLRH